MDGTVTDATQDRMAELADAIRALDALRYLESLGANVTIGETAVTITSPKTNRSVTHAGRSIVEAVKWFQLHEGSSRV
jgi:hypothetical protein